MKVFIAYIFLPILLAIGGFVYTTYFTEPKHDIGIIKNKYQDVGTGNHFIQLNDLQYQVSESEYKKVEEGDKVDISFTGGDFFTKQIKSVEKVK